MPNLNKVMLMGSLTRDPEQKFTPSGTAVTQIGLAVNHTYKTAGGEKREEVTFVDVEFWGKTAELIAEHYRKGRPIYVEGRLKLDSWDDKTTGQKRTKMRVVADKFEFLNGKEGSHQPAPRQQQAAPARRTSTPDPDLDTPDDDYPA